MGQNDKAVLNKRYKLLEKIGGGSQGEVWSVEDALFPTRKLALKLLTRQTRPELFRFEFAQATRLEHPHLGRVFDLGVVSSATGEEAPLGLPFFTQELIPGLPANLWAERLSQDELPTMVATVGIAVARALAMLHANGLLHRDVKPSNILVATGATTVKLIDLGLSRKTDMRDGLLAGTLGYMAPETLQGISDERSDIYSLGATLCHLLSGRRPHQGDTPGPVAPEGIPPKLWETVRRMVSPRPGERFAEAGEVVIALGRVMGGDILGGDRRWDLLDAASEPDDLHTRAARLRSSRLVGRRKERELLSRWLRDLFSDTGGPSGACAIVHGPAGVGKTRLINTVVTACQIEASENDREPPSFVHGSLPELIAALQQDDNVRCGPDEESLRAMSRVIASCPGPSIILVDDCDGTFPAGLLHWICEHFAKEGDSPVALMVETVSAQLSQLTQHMDISATVELGPLTRALEKTLVSEALGYTPTTAEMDSLRSRTGGIPLLTETILGAIARVPGKAAPALKDLELLDLPSTPGELVANGICATLSPLELQIAQALAVIAAPATADEIAAVCGLDKGDLIAAALVRLTQMGVLHDWAEEGRALPEMLADGVLASIEQPRLKEYHRAALDLLRAGTDTFPEKTARHALAIGDLKSARVALASAAELAERNGDPRGAARQLSLLLKNTGASEERDRVSLRLARLHRQTGQYNLAMEILGSLEHPEKQAGASLELGATLRLLGDEGGARSHLEMAATKGNQSSALEARALLARMALDAGELDKAEELLEVTKEPSAQTVDAGIAATAGMLELRRGDLDGAMELFSLGWKSAIETNDAKNQARFHGLRGMVHHSRSDFSRASEEYSAALAMADGAGDRHGAATYAVNLAAALTEMGKFGDALTRYRDGLYRLREVARSDELAIAGANYAQLLLRLGDRAGAEKASMLALADTDAGTSENARAVVLNVRGDVLISMYRPAEALSLLEMAEDLFSRFGGISQLAACRRHLTNASLLDGDTEGARKWMKRRKSLVDRGAPFELEDLATEVEMASLGGGDLSRALGELEEELPPPTKHLGYTVMEPLAVAARAASMLVRRENAREYAGRFLDHTAAMKLEVPSLHRDPDDSLEKEMMLILRGDNRYTQPAEEAGSTGGWGWERLVRINTRLNSELKIGALLDLIMDTALEVTGGQRGFLLVVDKHGKLRARSTRNMDRARLEQDEQDFSRSVARRAFETGEPVVTTDAQTDEQFKEAGSIMALGLHYIIAVPLQVRGVVSGTIYVDSRMGGRFDSTRLALLEALADQAALALTNARLSAENRRRQRRIEKLNRQLSRRLEMSEGALERARRDLEQKTGDLEARYRYAGMIGQSGRMSEVFRLLDRISDTDVPVVISGESGTGKELVAKAIHYNGARRGKPFVAENCTAIPGTLLESTLFGHVRGAFTGATSNREGLFAAAHEGTLFLDEIGDMPLDMQTKLLRVLQEGEVRPVGGGKPARVDVRILVASNANLSSLVKEGRFREDLYYRLQVVEVRLPPLRERREDIPLLADHFLQKHARGEKGMGISRGAVEMMMSYHWPGNVRQLENEIMRAMVLCDGILDVEHLSDSVADGSSFTSEDSADLAMDRHVDRLKKRLIRTALRRSGGNRSKAAQMLGISRYGLQKMMERIGL